MFDGGLVLSATKHVFYNTLTNYLLYVELILAQRNFKAFEHYL